MNPEELRSYRRSLVQPAVDKDNWAGVRELASMLEEPPPLPSAFSLEELASRPDHESHEDQFHNTAGFVLEHYTGAEGLIGMCGPGPTALRLSDLRFMSDEREFTYTVSMAEASVGSRLRRAREQGRTEDAQNLQYLMTTIRQPRPAIYVFCFSTEYDDLSQWRAYSPPGAGFAVGFSSRRILTLLESLPAGFRLAHCSYDQEIHSLEIDKLVEAVISPPDPSVPINTRIERFSNALTNFATVFKDPAFRAEREWRIISPLLDPETMPVKVRSSARIRSLVPYIEIPYTHDNHYLWPIEHVWVGPTPYMELAREAAERAIRPAHLPREGEQWVRLWTSSIPYRG